jgi:hypothetical protein
LIKSINLKLKRTKKRKSLIISLNPYNLESATSSLKRRKSFIRQDLSRRVLVIGTLFLQEKNSSKLGLLEMEVSKTGLKILSSSKQMEMTSRPPLRLSIRL